MTVNNAIFSKKYLFHSIIIIILSFLLIGCTSIPRERDDIFLDPVKNDLIETRIAKGDLVTIYKTSDIGMQVSTMISERFIILTLFMGNNSLDEKEFRLNNVNLYYKDSNGIKKLKPYNGEEYVKAYLGDYYYDADFNDVKYGLRRLYITDHDIQPKEIHKGLLAFDFEMADNYTLTFLIEGKEYIINYILKKK